LKGTLGSQWHGHWTADECLKRLNSGRISKIDDSGPSAPGVLILELVHQGLKPIEMSGDSDCICMGSASN
jgi:hypothetical protein